MFSITVLSSANNSTAQSSNLHIEVGELQEENYRLVLLFFFPAIMSQRHNITHNLCYRPTTVTCIKSIRAFSCECLFSNEYK